MLNWLLSFVNVCLASNLIPKMCRLATILGILKLGMLNSSPENYRPMSLLRSSFQKFGKIDFVKITNRV